VVAVAVWVELAVPFAVLALTALEVWLVLAWLVWLVSVVESSPDVSAPAVPPFPELAVVVLPVTLELVLAVVPSSGSSNSAVSSAEHDEKASAVAIRKRPTPLAKGEGVMSDFRWRSLQVRRSSTVCDVLSVNDRKKLHVLAIVPAAGRKLRGVCKRTPRGAGASGTC
jgi:hypothetical protein